MAFRRQGKAQFGRSRRWATWLATNVGLLKAAGLPLSVLRTRADWEYLLRYGYHCTGPYPAIDYSLEEMSLPQKTAFRQLLEQTLTHDEKQRGSAAWHFVCPPGQPK
jgi:hypothetical protein